MSTKKNNNHPPQFGSDDISTIQNILFGQHIQEIQKQFSRLENKLDLTDTSQEKVFHEFKTQTETHLNDLEKRLTEKTNELEEKMTKQFKELEEQIVNVSKSDKQNLASMLQKLSTNLIKAE